MELHPDFFHCKIKETNNRVEDDISHVNARV